MAVDEQGFGGWQPAGADEVGKSRGHTCRSGCVVSILVHLVTPAVFCQSFVICLMSWFKYLIVLKVVRAIFVDYDNLTMLPPAQL